MCSNAMKIMKRCCTGLGKLQRSVNSLANHAADRFCFESGHMQGASVWSVSRVGMAVVGSLVKPLLLLLLLPLQAYGEAHEADQQLADCVQVCAQQRPSAGLDTQLDLACCGCAIFGW
jgi:hypothetical protein